MPRHARWITSIASSGHQGRTFFGSPTSPMSRPGAALSMSPSSSTLMPAGSLAGGARARRTPALCSMRWSRPCPSADRSIAAASCTIATGAANTSRSNIPSVWLKQALSLVGSVGDSYDNALAETINGLYKAEVIHRRGPWRSFEAVEFATLEWVDWFNNRRLLEPIGNIPPAEAEQRYYAMLEQPTMAA